MIKNVDDYDNLGFKKGDGVTPRRAEIGRS